MKEAAAFPGNAFILTHRVWGKTLAVIKAGTLIFTFRTLRSETEHRILAAAAEQFDPGEGFFKKDLIAEAAIQNH